MQSSFTQLTWPLLLFKTPCKNSNSTGWTQIWTRQRPNIDDLWPSLQEHLPPRAEVAHWTSLTHEDLRQAAKPCRGTSAGLDGWTTEEVYAFSDDMLATLAAFYNKCESLGQAPAAWKMTRQVHLSKDKKLQSDGSSLAGDLRPVSVASMMWRVWPLF